MRRAEPTPAGALRRLPADAELPHALVEIVGGPPYRGSPFINAAAEYAERGPGFVTASVVDPFGNILGVMYNQHYVEISGAQAGA